jgi:diacylglycerol O-acyltransferase / wax synthase
MWARQSWALIRVGRAPLLSWNQPIGSRRRVTLVRADLEAARAVAHAHHGKVNDVVLTAVAEGAHRLLNSRGQAAANLALHVVVAVSIRRPGDPVGNRVGIRLITVSAGEASATQRLEAIAVVTAAQRGRPPYQPSGRLLQHWMVRTMSRQRLINLIVSNLPGPPAPLEFAGARVREICKETSASALQSSPMPDSSTSP